MPSKRKKNKRRMTRVQAQRRILEEQYAANPPAKASRGTGASVPPAAASRLKCTAPAPQKILEAVTTSEVISKPVTPEPEAAAAAASPTEVQAEAADVGAGETPVATETAEAESEATPEAEAALPDTEAGTQVSSPAEAPAEAPEETEILTEETATVTTEPELRHETLEAKTEEEPEAPAEEEAPVETEMEVAITEAPEEPEVTAQAGGRVSPVEEPAAVAEAAVEPAEVEVAADVLKPEPITEIVSGGEEEEEEEAEMEVLAAEEASEVSAETTDLITKTEVPQDAPVQPMEIQGVGDAPLEEAEASAAEVKEDIVDNLADDFVVTETAEAVEVAIAESSGQLETVEMSEALNSQSEASNESVAESVAEVVAPPAEEAMDADGQACLDAPLEEPKLEEPKLEEPKLEEPKLEEPKLEVCEMPCQKQLAVESSLSGHVVPEVTIEG
ncbi:fibrous sheath CABYR-binding protein-like isoform X2 [Takifugu flavidus]|uniref:fibrous sheath CABYR-binding protein-like isoform X2 n=1 Tax=Takifugu flavidus TaxID=433684 RepID=UPI00254461B5|nr:fibrous sheath CABYR-binding protein-like isoform X2 [Takifugu flavidus]